MDQESISKLIPVLVLLILGSLEALGGLYFHDKRSKNDITIELVCLTVLPTLISTSNSCTSFIFYGFLVFNL